MFQIPEWEESVPSTDIDINFDKTLKKKRRKRKPACENDESKANNKKEKVSQHNGLLKQNKSTKYISAVEKSINCQSLSKNDNNNLSKNIPQSNNRRLVHSNPNFTEPTNSKGRKKTRKPPIKSGNRELIKKPSLDSHINNTNTDLNESFNQSLETDKLDEYIINTKKRKLSTFNNKEEKDVEEMFSQSSQPLSKKKQLLKNMLRSSHRNEIKVHDNSLRDRMLQRLKAAQFRYINEKLYTSSGSDAKKLFQEDSDAFKTYHQGYQQQVKKWPVNPIDVIVRRISRMPNTHVVADMGCGEAVLSTRVKQKVHSFDLVSFNSQVQVCDIAHTPLLANSVNVAVYCLSLMGTDLIQYLVEANRILKTGGHLLIAEVESRFDNVDAFVSGVQKIGFSLKTLDNNNQMFYFMEFNKVQDPPKKSKLPYLYLKPCLYKKR